MPIPHTTLKSRHRQERDTWPADISLRIHRSLSWLHCAESCQDEDGRFIFLWIAFNAAYASDDESIRLGEGTRYTGFLKRLVALDGSGCLEALVWDGFSGPFRVLLNNRYVFQPFWDHARKASDASDWEERFNRANAGALQAIARKDTPRVLRTVFSRLYTLRNQLVHGGATWGSSTNRHQLRDGVRIMSELVPLLIQIMMDNPAEAWGEVCYPVQP